MVESSTREERRSRPGSTRVRHPTGTFVSRVFPHGEAFVLALFDVGGDVERFHAEFDGAEGTHCGATELLRVVYWDSGYFNLETTAARAEIPVDVVTALIAEARRALQ